MIWSIINNYGDLKPNVDFSKLILDLQFSVVCFQIWILLCFSRFVGAILYLRMRIFFGAILYLLPPETFQLLMIQKLIAKHFFWDALKIEISRFGDFECKY